MRPALPLPAGWVAFLDEEGAEYYFHPESGAFKSLLITPGL